MVNNYRIQKAGFSMHPAHSLIAALAIELKIMAIATYIMEKTVITALTLFLLLPAVLGANIYKELQKSTNFCQEKDATCKMSSGFYGCCPAMDGVCCAGGNHCCPSGYKCDLPAKRCLKYEDQTVVYVAKEILHVASIGAEVLHKVMKVKHVVPRIPIMMKAKPRIAGNYGPNGVDCPGGDVCLSNHTCCVSLATGKYEGCCPTHLGNCCFDYMSCCDSGYVCDRIRGTNNCIKAGY